jgi:hypothetical protein
MMASLLSISRRRSTVAAASGAAFRRLARGPNTDTAIYGGRDVRNAAGMETLKGSPIPEVTLVVPTFAAVFLVPEE